MVASSSARGRKAGKDGNEVQAIVDKGDSLEKVELAMALEELGED